MSNTPILGAPELAPSQAIPETTVNEAVRFLEQGAGWFRILDRDLTAPPGSPSDGDCYLVATSATGDWSGHDDEIAFYMSSAWAFITPQEGMGAYIADEDASVVFDGADWNAIGGGGSLALDDLTDVDATSPNNGDILTYDSGTNTWEAAPPAGSTGSAADDVLDNQFFGDGSDGDVTISSGTTVLTRDMYYNSLTISGTGSLDPRGFRIFVKGTLDISAAPNRAIYVGVSSLSRNGGNGAAQSGGIGGNTTVDSNATIGTAATAGNNGANGGTGAGTQANAAATPTNAIGSGAGGGGDGGGSGVNSGGTARAATAPTTPLDLRRLNTDLALFFGNTFTKIKAGIGAPGGSSGGGDGTGLGGGGGGGGAGGGIIFVAARTINRSGSTASGAISAVGGNGGNGSAGNLGTNRGGGGGGGGGSGGWIYLIYRTLTGSTASNCLDVTGGAGGAGGNGTGTGLGGDGGGAGGGGRVDVYDLGAGTQSITETTAATAGNAASGSTGGAAKTATAHRVSL